MCHQSDSNAAPPRRSRARRRLGDEIRDAILEDFIMSGASSPGELLPTEAEMCRRYDVSRVTVRAALRSLQETGYISVRQGRGSTVLARPEMLTSGIDRLRSFESYARSQLRSVESSQLEVMTVTADDETAERLEVEPGTPTLVVKRVKVYDGTPIGWIVDWIPEGFIDFDTVIAEYDGSVLDVLLNHQELRVEYADCDIVPIALDGDLAARLEVEPGTPVLYLDEQTRTRDGLVINWSQAWLLPEQLRFCVRRRA